MVHRYEGEAQGEEILLHMEDKCSDKRKGFFSRRCGIRMTSMIEQVLSA